MASSRSWSTMLKRIGVITAVVLSFFVSVIAWAMFLQGYGTMTAMLALVSTAATVYLVLVGFTSIQLPRKRLWATLAAVGQILMVGFLVLRVTYLRNEEMNRIRRQFLIDRNPTATQHIYLFAGSGVLLLHDEVQGKVTRAWSTMDREIKTNPGTTSFVYYLTRDGQFRQTNATYILSSDPLDFEPVIRVEHVESKTGRSSSTKSTKSRRSPR